MMARLAAVGADPRDDETMKRRKALLVLISVLILPIAVVWGGLYLIFGSWVGYVPLAYALILLGALVAFARTGNFALLLRANLVAILFGAHAVDDPVGRLPSVSRRRVLGHACAARRSRLQWTTRGTSLVHRLRRGVPQRRDRRADPGARLDRPGLVHEHDAR